MRQKTRWGQIAVAVAMAMAVPRPSTSAEQGTITGFAGTGSAGYSGDGGPAEEADLNDPRTVAVDGQGNVFIADTLNNVIRKVDTTGVITTVAGTGTAGEGGDGGPATAAQIQWPHGVAVDRAGNVYIADSPHHRIRRVDTSGVITTVAGTGRSGFGGDGGPATAARLDNPKGVAVDDQGRLYIADTGNGRVRRLEASGTISTVAGNGDVGGAGDGGPATAAQVTYPRSISLDGAGDLFISEDTEGDISRIRKVDTAGVITRFAGTGVPGFSGDGGAADQAQLNRPRGIAADRAGNLYISDSENNRIRKVDTDGVITTIAGTGRQGSRGDGGSAADAELSVPRGLGVAPNGDLYVADTFASRVRRISGAAVPATQPPPPRPPSATPPPSGGDDRPPPSSPPPPPAAPRRSGYWMTGSDGRTYNFGDAAHHGDAQPLAPQEEVIDLEPTPSGNGYRMVTSRGRVFAFGDAIWRGNATPLATGEVVTSLSATRSGNGYWMFTTRGRVLAFGDATHYGDMAATRLNGPVLDSIPTASGRGYYMVSSDGGIFSFGDAKFYGSMGDKKLNAPVQSLVPDGDGVGYWLVASDGGIFAFEAPFKGSMGNVRLNKPVTGMVRFGNGYLMVGEDGGIFNFSDKAFHGSLGDTPPAHPIVSVAALDQ